MVLEVSGRQRFVTHDHRGFAIRRPRRDSYLRLPHAETGPSRSEEWASVHRHRNPQTIENSDLAHKVRQRLANETTVNRAMQAVAVLTERLFYRT